MAMTEVAAEDWIFIIRSPVDIVSLAVAAHLVPGFHGG
jgi:hypothetical protein